MSERHNAPSTTIAFSEAQLVEVRRLQALYPDARGALLTSASGPAATSSRCATTSPVISPARPESSRI